MAGGTEEHARRSSPEGAREVVRTISHNLRTPLAVIKGCTDMLLMHDLDEDHRRELLLTAAANVERLAEAVAWLEGSFEDLTRDTTIRLPETREDKGDV